MFHTLMARCLIGNWAFPMAYTCGVVMKANQTELDGDAGRALTCALADIGAAPEIEFVPIGASKLTSTLSPRLAARSSSKIGGVPVIVADSISTPVRQQLAVAGINWLDRRGHLRINAPGIFIDTAIPAQPRRAEQPRAVIDRPIRGNGGLAVAVDALCRTAAGEPLSTGADVARRAGLSQPTVSVASRALGEAGLIGRNGALIPELFWEVAAIWRPEWVNLTRLPEGKDGLGLVAGDTRAAIHHGIGLVITDQFPWELYASDRQTGHLTKLLYGYDQGPTVARVAFAPTPLALEDQVVTKGSPFPYVNPIIAALDAASDPSRGAEAVRDWNPTTIRRVW